MFVRRQLRDPSVNFLAAEAGASWIRYPDPFLFTGRPASQEVSLFRTRFRVGSVPTRAVLTVRGFKVAIVQIDRATVGTPRMDPKEWKEPVELDLAPFLRVGTHELQLAVLNSNSHACVLAYCPEFGLKTDSGWEASHDGNAWGPAVCVENVAPPPPKQDRSFRVCVKSSVASAGG
jgi:hypothetical protein